MTLPAAAAITRYLCCFRPPPLLPLPLVAIAAAAAVKCNHRGPLPPPSATPAVTASHCCRPRRPCLPLATFFVNPDHCALPSATLAADRCRCHRQLLSSLSAATAANAIRVCRGPPLSLSSSSARHCWPLSLLPLARTATAASRRHQLRWYQSLFTVSTCVRIRHSCRCRRLLLPPLTMVDPGLLRIPRSVMEVLRTKTILTDLAEIWWRG